ncbi:MAG TPA: hypothetical protein VGH13_24855 [Xanthobacteraceae bacterium]|jgi:hypothetical protein
MKLKAPEGVGDPCVAGVAVAARDGLYEADPDIGAVLVECFGFVEIDTPGPGNASAPWRPHQPRKRQPGRRRPRRRRPGKLKPEE